ncbi:SAM-dependent methyltransferase [Streptacidiphilus sp. N1-12]|uniref:SAM-dependent methyltransferase n=2 Tax=Streptacidiphilus alkalitolerans TaxID=3342712 RepID=A0ABV6X2W6_9ACTN
MGDQPGADKAQEQQGASIARVYDLYLGGGHNLPADDGAAEAVVEVMPELPALLRVSLDFLKRCVRHLSDTGVRSFLDLGAGIPTMDNVHEIAQAADATARTVYVDNDPLAARERRVLVAGNDRALSIEADLRDADRVLGDPEAARLLRLGSQEPFAVLLSSVLHFITDDDQVRAVIAAYGAAMPPGSYLMISHGTAKPGAAQRLERAAQLYSKAIAPMKLRSKEELASLVSDFELIEPGVVYCANWRPDLGYQAGPDEQALPQIGLLARKN